MVQELTLGIPAFAYLYPETCPLFLEKSHVYERV